MAAALAAMLALAFASTVSADDALDQSVPTGGASPQTNLFQQLGQMAQTFTAGQSGQLDRVSLFQGAPGFTAPTFTIQVWTVDRGQATLAAAGTPASFSARGSLGTTAWHDFTLNPAVAVTAGTQYAIVLVTRPNTVRWGFMNSYSYAGGNLWLCCDATGKWMPTRTSDFGFRTYLGTAAPPVNRPPAVAADSAAVTFNEGAAQSNTGTYSDPDGDSVTLTASAGSLTRTGTSTGTWSWNQAAADEGPTQTVTVTAADGQGHSVSTSFSVSVVAVAPTARIVTDPPTIPEGTSEPFTGSATSPSATDTAAGFTYAWTVTKNGNAYSTGSGTKFSFAPNDEGTYVVTFKATDDGQMSDSDSLTVIGTNVSPTATITGYDAAAPLVIAPQELLTFHGAFTDPGVLDTHSANWDFGDGTSGSGLTSSHSYAKPGTYRVVLTVTDDDNGVGTATTYVTVQTTQVALSKIAGYINDKVSSLNKGQKNSLTVKLSNASAAAGRGDTNAANNELNAFLNELRADQNAGKISSADATTLRNAVYAVKGSLGTYNRFLEWWPLAL